MQMQEIKNVKEPYNLRYLTNENSKKGIHHLIPPFKNNPFTTCQPPHLLLKTHKLQAPFSKKKFFDFF